MPYLDREKQREFNRLWMQKRKKAWLEANGPCASCGATENLEVDHVDPTTKSMNPGTIWSQSEARRGEELAKCQVLCHDCHQEKTSAYSFAKVKHGTTTMYDSHGCRCELCRAYKSERNKKRYLRSSS